MTLILSRGIKKLSKKAFKYIPVEEGTEITIEVGGITWLIEKSGSKYIFGKCVRSEAGGAQSIIYAVVGEHHERYMRKYRVCHVMESQ